MIDYISKKYIEIVEEIKSKYKTPENVEEALTSVLKKWQTGRKVARSSYIIPLASKISDKTQIKPIENILICLDVIINALDDTVDTAQATKREKWEREVIKMVIFLYVISELNRNIEDQNTREFIIDSTLNFIISISQIPWVEKEYSEKINNAKTEDEEIRLTIECLEQRARDIDIFIELSMPYLNLGQNKNLKFKNMIKLYRKLELFSKDYDDLERDIKDNANTPTVSLFKKYKNNEKEFQKRISIVSDELFSQFDKNIKNIEINKEALYFIKDIINKKYNQIKSKI